MGEETCTCLNNLTGFDSEDLSREGNKNDNNKNNKNNNNNKPKKKQNKKPKVVVQILQNVYKLKKGKRL